MPIHVYRQGKPVGTRVEPREDRIWPGTPLLEGAGVIPPARSGLPAGGGTLDPESGTPAGPREEEARNP